jgi:hypothetical protein
MSRLPSAGGVLGSIVEGAQTVLGRLAQWFRLGQFAPVQPPTVPQPGRTPLSTPEEIWREAQARHLTPPAGGPPMKTVTYWCIVTDPDTGETLARIPHPIDFPEGTPKSTLYSRARRYAVSQLPRYLPGRDLALNPVKMTCRMGREGVQDIPTVSP